MKKFVAIDIGASSGRFISGLINESKIILEEIHRFDNKMVVEDVGCFWDLDNMIAELKNGLRKVACDGVKPTSIGIDTWGVDYVLLDKDGKPLNKPFSYRDSRTDGIMEEFFNILPQNVLYEKTGVQFAQYNTLFQLFAELKNRPGIFEKTSSILMMPDYLNYFLTGNRSNEFTNATTTQMLNIKTRNWDDELLKMLGIPSTLFCDMKKPGTVLGNIKSELLQEVSLSGIPVVLPATHVLVQLLLVFLHQAITGLLLVLVPGR